MSDVVIRAEQLAKKYRLGTNEPLFPQMRRALKRFFRGAKAEVVQEQGTGPIFWALDDVSFEVKQGEKVGIIGRNGAGKSTLLKVLSRVVYPTRGWARVCGRVGSLLEVGTGFHHDLTAKQNIYLNGAILGMGKKEIDRKFDEILAFAEIEQFMDTPLKHYSSGMLSRLAFAVAAHLETDILLVDEVLSVGDASFQKKSLGKMNELTGGGRTVLFVSHDLSTLARLCNRVIYMERGRIIADGEPGAVITRYLNTVDGNRAVQTWDEEKAPGNEDLKLICISLQKGDGSSATVVPVEDRIQVKITYRTLKPNMQFRCSVIFFTEGVCAFPAMESQEHVRPEPGVYCSTLELPPHLLAEREYLVTLSIFASRGVKLHYVYEKDVLRFQVTDPAGGESARGDYTERLGGVLRPKLDWRMEYKQAS
jgi:lipopolysaccharide transport system ATP-binding protein